MSNNVLFEEEKILKALYNASIGYWTNGDACISIAEELNISSDLKLWSEHE